MSNALKSRWIDNPEVSRAPASSVMNVPRVGPRAPETRAGARPPREYRPLPIPGKLRFVCVVGGLRVRYLGTG